MKKVFHDLHRWKKRWFKNLGAEGRDVWNWLLDSVYETYGVWEIDLKDMENSLGYPVTLETIRKVFGDRIHEVGDQKLFIPDHIIFQYGELSEECRPHRSVIRELKRLGLFELYLKQLAYSSGTVPELTKNKNNTRNKTNSSFEEGEFEGKPQSVGDQLAALSQINSAIDLWVTLPILTIDKWKAKFTLAELELENAKCFEFHILDPATRPRTVGQWHKKFHTWMTNCEEARKTAKAAAAKSNLDNVDLTAGVSR